MTIYCNCGEPIYKLSQLVYWCKSCGKLYEVQLKQIGQLERKQDDGETERRL